MGQPAPVGGGGGAPAVPEGEPKEAGGGEPISEAEWLEMDEEERKNYEKGPDGQYYPKDGPGAGGGGGGGDAPHQDH
jgi:hypothetical protein